MEDDEIDDIDYFRDKIVINIGGRRFETLRHTLTKHPNSRLAHLNPKSKTYDAGAGEYFFDRNPKLFACILEYYRTDELHLPASVCGPKIKKELEFWGISCCGIPPCCWGTYKQFEEDQAALSTIEEEFRTHHKAGSQVRSWRERIWFAMENPCQSNFGKVLHLWHFLVTLSSIVIFMFETQRTFRVWDPDGPTKLQTFGNTTNPKIYLYLATKLPLGLMVVDRIITVKIFLSVVVRFAICMDKLSFVKDLLNIFDFLACVPILVQYFIELTPLYLTDRTVLCVCESLTLFKLFRSFRLFWGVRHYIGLRVLFLTVKASWRELVMLIIFILTGTAIFSSAMYFTEFFQEDTFENLPVGQWWAVVTMTTVGYGDKHPKTYFGYAVGAMCALVGMVGMGLPIPIIASNFNLYYSHLKRIRAERQRIDLQAKLRLEDKCDGCEMSENTNKNLKFDKNEDFDEERTKILVHEDSESHSKRNTITPLTVDIAGK